MINMTPPPFRDVKIAKPTWRVLLTKDTGKEVFLDQNDWNLVKDVDLIEKNGEICVGTGENLQKYLKISGKRLKYASKFDFRRRNFK